jgi:hypothetical protein
MALIKNLSFAPLHADKELETAIAWLNNPSRRETFFYATNFALIHNDDVFEYTNQPCHREIMGTGTSRRSLVATESGVSRRTTAVGIGDIGLFQPFFDWFTTESFASQFILWSDVSVGFVVSADVYTPLLQNIMIMTRHFYEVHENAFKNFNKMVQAGVSGDIAYPIAFNSNASTSSPTNAKFQSMYSHRVTHLFDFDAFKNFVSGVVGKATPDINEPSRHYRTFKDYNGGRNIFWDKNVPTYHITTEAAIVSTLMSMSKFRDVLSEYRKGKTGGFYKAPNPFAPTPQGFVAPSPTEVSIEEAIDVVAPFLQSILY